MRQRKIIALLTDFGTGDAYVGVMKGVIGRLAPEANVIDISHQVAPQAIDQAAYLLWSAYRYFPQGTIFICVVDPGVGGRRRILCAEIAGRYFLVPDNGILKYILGEATIRRCVSVENPSYREETVSPTFHGRDILAPAAASLARGTSMTRLGPRVQPCFLGEPFARPLQGVSRRLTGKVLHIDNFGNCITNVLLPKTRKPRLSVTIGGKLLRRFAGNYEDAEPDLPFLLRGSCGLLEISVRNGSAAKLLRVKPAQRLLVRVVAQRKGRGPW